MVVLWVYIPLGFPPYIFVYFKRIDVIMASNKSYICLLHYLVQIFLIETDLGESL